MGFDLNFSEQLFLWWLSIMVIIFIWHAWIDPYGNIHYAASEGKLDKVRKYLERGVFVDVQKNQGPTPLYVASVTGHREIVELLIAYGAMVNQGLDEEDGMNPLLAATVEEHQDVIESLMAHGAVAGIHVATFRGEINTLRTYLERGGDVNAKQNGMSLLHLAVLGNRQETVRLLLANNADINIRDLNGEAPLYGAVTKNHVELAELLIERGGNLNQISARGSPLHLAIQRSALL
ncbi:MAG: ankyrin repeat domain-containing protein [Cyanobacteriota bacterium]|nr:ankyrin repeat domain-containing protein [Cyanobacteriota bacterium]